MRWTMVSVGVLASVVACGGSWLVRPELVHEGRFDEIERLARAAREMTP